MGRAAAGLRTSLRDLNLTTSRERWRRGRPADYVRVVQGKAGVDLAEIVRAVNAGELQVSDADQMGTTDYAHTDGWAGEVQQPGVDLRPDFFFLVCEEWDAHGGESFVIDGQAILDTLPPATREALLTIPLPRGSRTPRPFLNRCVTR